VPTIADDLGLTRDEWSMVREICCARTSPKNGVEDLLQEAAVELLLKAGELVGLPPANRRRIIRIIVRNRLLNVQRGEDAEAVGLREDVAARAVDTTGALENDNEHKRVPLRPWVCVRHQWILQQLAKGMTTREIAAQSRLGQRQIQRLVKAAREVVGVYWRG
jgi:DNA-directed RNA polymerase specialized sigma24 family protein